MSNVRGFTLVEILVVIAIVAIMGTIMVVIFTNTLKGSNKAQILAVIKQNGQAVLENMDKTIRNADNLVCVSSPTPNSLVVVQNGVYTRYRITEPSPPPPNSAVNGFIQQDNPIKETDTATGQEETGHVFVNRVCTPANPMVNPIVLTDTNPQSGVSLSSGSFSLNRLAGFKDNVKVTFVLSHGVGVPVAIAGQIDPVTFETTIQLR